ncbi:MAG: squalene/phytoene synthase family protein [Acidobacteriia bacterium]|nr:squalene/phytoene synthase family protein [Methyloceanibacter sp.]MBX5472134.1 squalene/phytoene synthase family protein [Acetobacteraceae bacterium]MCL6491175.1 squalene/phytoene synthase family protein [Terriglobia bacterium]
MLSALAGFVRRHDPDRFLTALFAPPERRETLFLLYAFNHELARAREVTSHPTLALLRLQWWREILEGAERQHEIAAPLRAALAAGALAPDLLLEMIAAREAEAEANLPDLPSWRAYVLGAGGALAAAAGRVLGAPAALDDAFRAAGAAYMAAGLLRSVAFHARRNRCLLPADLLAAQGLSPEAAIADPTSPAVAKVKARLAEDVRGWMKTAKQTAFPRPMHVAALPLVFAKRDLARMAVPPRPRGLPDRLAVIRAGLSGRL